MGIKKHLRILFAILISASVSVRAVPPSSVELLSFLNFRYGRGKTSNFTTRGFIVDAYGLLFNKFAGLYEMNEIFFLAEGMLRAMGIFIFTNEARNCVCSLVIPSILNPVIKCRFGRHYTSIENYFTDFGFESHVPKTYSPFKSIRENELAANFYKNLYECLGRIPGDMAHGYTGGPFFQNKTLTMYYSRKQPNASVPVLPGLPPLPSEVSEHNEILEFNKLVEASNESIKSFESNSEFDKSFDFLNILSEFDFSSNT